MEMQKDFAKISQMLRKEKMKNNMGRAWDFPTSEERSFDPEYPEVLRYPPPRPVESEPSIEDDILRITEKYSD